MDPFPDPPEAPTNTAALSLFELRRHLLRQAGVLSARARGLRGRGAGSLAKRADRESEHLVEVARSMVVPDPKADSG